MDEERRRELLGHTHLGRVALSNEDAQFFDESKVKRNKGQFASKGGASEKSADAAEESKIDDDLQADTKEGFKKRLKKFKEVRAKEVADTPGLIGKAKVIGKRLLTDSKNIKNNMADAGIGTKHDMERAAKRREKQAARSKAIASEPSLLGKAKIMAKSIYG